MAERRMFARSIIDSDAFLDMGASAQCLYFHLGMRADDEGFVNNPKKIQRMIGAADDDMKILIAKRYVLVFESGVLVIKHWKIHNYIQKDRFKPTLYKEERELLAVKDNKSYTEADRIHDVYNPDTQVRLGKVSQDKTISGGSGSLSESEMTALADGLNSVLNAANAAGFPDTSATWDKLNLIVADHGADAVLAAIDICVEANVCNLRYLKGILNKDKQDDKHGVAPGYVG